MFKEAICTIPYWAQCEDDEIRKRMIDVYWLNKDLSANLSNNHIPGKKIKI